jgi:hypothetical protein
VEVVKAMDVGLQGCVHLSQVDLSAVWFCVTLHYFHFLLRRGKYYDLTVFPHACAYMRLHVRIHVCVNCSAQNVIYLEQDVSATANLEM